MSRAPAWLRAFFISLIQENETLPHPCHARGRNSVQQTMSLMLMTRWWSATVDAALDAWAMTAVLQAITMLGMSAMHHWLLDGALLPDLLLPGQGYSPKRLHAILHELGAQKRSDYLLIELYDLVPYMWVYTLSLAVLMRAASRRMPSLLPDHIALALPLLPLVADFVENVGQMYACYNWTTHLYRDDHVALALARMATVANTVKWLSFGGCAFLAIAMLLLTSAPPQKKDA